jgi:hypothetical protein
VDVQSRPKHTSQIPAAGILDDVFNRKIVLLRMLLLKKNGRDPDFVRDFNVGVCGNVRDP